MSSREENIVSHRAAEIASGPRKPALATLEKTK